MRAYIIRRLLLLIPTLIMVTMIVFLTIRFIPGDVIEIMAAEMAAEGAGTEMNVDYLREVLGLDAPIHIQYVRWLGIFPQPTTGNFSGIAQGDFGDALWSGLPVTRLIFERVPITLELATLAIIAALLIAIPIGVYSGIRQDTGGDYIGRSIAILAISIPNFWVGTLVIVFPSIWWRWSPSLRYLSPGEDLLGNMVQFIIPALLMGMTMSGTTMRLTRTMMLEVLRQDYIRTAWAKGLTERVIVVRHALKNALIPVISMMGLSIPIVIAGTVIMEQIFILPGIGLLLLEALSKRDYPIISGINLMIAGVVIILNLLIDLSYGWFDPRIRYD